jgi:hypothetical protein
MSTLDTLNDAAFKIKHELVAAQKAFVKLPNSTNWQVCLRTMFSHQQLEFAIRSTLVDKDKLAFDLINNPRGEWNNVICRATVGMDSKQSLQEFAVF